MTTLCVSMRWKILENRLACYFLHKLDETTSPNDCDKSAVDHWRKFCNSGGFCDQPGAAHAGEPGGTGATHKSSREHRVLAGQGAWVQFALVAGDRADGVVDAGVSVDRVGDLPDFWNSHATCALRRGLAEYYFFLRHVCPDLFYGQEAGGQRGGQRRGMAVGYFS